MKPNRSLLDMLREAQAPLDTMVDTIRQRTQLDSIQSSKPKPTRTRQEPKSTDVLAGTETDNPWNNVTPEIMAAADNNVFIPTSFSRPMERGSFNVDDIEDQGEVKRRIRYYE